MKSPIVVKKLGYDSMVIQAGQHSLQLSRSEAFSCIGRLERGINSFAADATNEEYGLVATLIDQIITTASEL